MKRLLFAAALLAAPSLAHAQQVTTFRGCDDFACFTATYTVQPLASFLPQPLYVEQMDLSWSFEFFGGGGLFKENAADPFIGPYAGHLPALASGFDYRRWYESAASARTCLFMGALTQGCSGGGWAGGVSGPSLGGFVPIEPSVTYYRAGEMTPSTYPRADLGAPHTVQLTITPEPSTVALLVVGLLAIAVTLRSGGQRPASTRTPPAA